MTFSEAVALICFVKMVLLKISLSMVKFKGKQLRRCLFDDKVAGKACIIK